MLPNSLPGLFLLCAFLPLLSAGGSAADIQVDFSPSPGKVTPLHDLVDITVTVGGGIEGPVDLSVRLWAPPGGSVFTTDFPLVEGTQLIQMNVQLPKGRLDWSYVFPIRGTYRLELEAVDAAGHSLERTVAIEVHEHWTKWFFLIAFFVGLFALGVVAGKLFSGQSASACLVAATAVLLAIANAKPAGAEVESRLTVSSPKVGALSTIRWTMASPGQQGIEPAVLTMRIIQLEKDETVFKLEQQSSRDGVEFGFQFTDASDHLVEGSVTPASGREVVAIRETVRVTSGDPSLRDRLMPVLVSLLVVVAGLVTGRLSHRRALRN